MSYIKEKQNFYKKNKATIFVMVSYIEDFDFLFQCIGIDNEYIFLSNEHMFKLNKKKNGLI